MARPVAVIAAHPDDEVLGCGGTIALLSAQGRPVHVLLLADGETSRPAAAAEASCRVAERGRAAQEACRILGGASVEVDAFPDNRMDGVELLAVVQRIEAFLSRHRPGMVLTHHAGDVNIDHRVVHDAVVAACRPLPGTCIEELLFFEVPSATEWRPRGSAPPFVPDWFFDVSATLERKLAALQAYAGELREFPHPRSLRAVEALARWRGASAGVGAAEAFMLGRRIVAG